MTKTMKAVVFDGPGKISVQDRPVPQIQDDGDVILKVEATALCGSELHVFRGLEPDCGAGFIMGHEFVGSVVEAGPAVAALAVGDRVVAPFTVSCGACFYCAHHMSSRCQHVLLFGSAKLDGGQAEFVRVPRADATLVKAPLDVKDNRTLVLMADIFPTGYFGARNAFRLLAPDNVAAAEAVVAVVGCGPVGLCAIVAALDHKPKHVFAIDSVESRLRRAQQLGAEPLNFATIPGGKEALVERIRSVTDGRGADAVIEVVGLSAALRTAFDVVRPFGVISSIGVHHGDAIPWTGGEAYGKNVQVRMGRCPVRSIFEEALAVLVRHQHKFDFMFDKLMPLTAAEEGYALFDQMKVQKVVFTP